MRSKRMRCARYVETMEEIRNVQSGNLAGRDGGAHGSCKATKCENVGRIGDSGLFSGHTLLDIVMNLWVP
jgi:hypothetical protein